MSDRAFATLTIGGTLNIARLGELVEAADEDDEELTDDNLRLTSSQNTRLVLSGERGGAWWEGIELFCQANNLTYYRMSDGVTGQWDDEIVFWSPALGRELTQLQTSSGDAVVSLSVLTTALDEDRTLADVVAAYAWPSDAGEEFVPPFRLACGDCEECHASIQCRDFPIAEGFDHA